MGGKDNVSSLWHCITRIRFNVKDDNKVNLDGLGGLEGVVGARYQNGQYQIIIGSNVASVFSELEAQLEVDDGGKKEYKSKNILSNIIDTISGVFNPILPAIVGAGLFKAILSLVAVLAPSAVETDLYALFNVISDAAFYFLPFLLASSSARLFKVNTSLALSVAGVLMYPTILNNAGESLSIFGVSLPFLDYSSSVIPIILGVFLLKIVDDFVRKYVPEMFSYVFIPMISLGITVPITLIALAPLGHYFSIYFAQGVNWLFTNMAPVAGLVYVGLMPLIIMTGMHYAFFPTAIQSLGTLGFDLVLLPANLIHNVAQAGAAFGVALKAKNNKEMRSTAISTGISAIFGITEPAMYGVNLKYKKPFYAVMASGGLVGMIAVSLKLKAYAFAIPGILSLPGYADGVGTNLIIAIVSYIASGVLAFVLTLILKFDIETTNQDVEIASPTKGKIVSLSKVPDAVFADKIMGDGFAIIPEEDVFYAPFDGTVEMIFKTKHALAFKGKNDIEVLYHVGLDTVDLDGEHFEVLVSEKENVKKGQPVLRIDRQAILDKGYDIITPIIITNTKEFEDFTLLNEDKNVNATDAVMKVK